MFNYLLEFLRGCAVNYAPKPEELICIRFASYMKEMTLTGKCMYVWFHVSNEGSSKGKHLWGARQRNMGKFAGVSDYVFMKGDSSFAIEIKAGKKKLQDSQITFKQWCEDCKVPYLLAISYEEAVQLVNQYKIVNN